MVISLNFHQNRIRHMINHQQLDVALVYCGSLASVHGFMPACPSRVSAHIFRRCIALFLVPPTHSRLVLRSLLRRSSPSEEFTRSVQWRRATELCPHRLAFRSITLYWSVTWRKKKFVHCRHHTQCERSHNGTDFVGVRRRRSLVELLLLVYNLIFLFFFRLL